MSTFNEANAKHYINQLRETFDTAAQFISQARTPEEAQQIADKYAKLLRENGIIDGVVNSLKCELERRVKELEALEKYGVNTFLALSKQIWDRLVWHGPNLLLEIHMQKLKRGEDFLPDDALEALKKAARKAQ